MRSIVLLLLCLASLVSGAEMAVKNLDCAQNARARIGTILVSNRERTASVQAAVTSEVAKWSLAAMDPATFGFLVSAKADNLCSITATLKVLTSPNQRWAASDVGKTIHITGAGVGGAVLATTIAGYTNAGSVTLTDAAVTTVAASSSSADGLAIWGQVADMELMGSPLINGNSLLYPQAINLSAAGATVTATGGTVSRSLAARAADAISVADFGAIGDGATDDSASIQAALTYIDANGGVLRMGRGKTYKVTVPLTLISTDTSASRHNKTRAIDGCGSTLSFASGAFAEDYTTGAQVDLLTIGTAANTADPANPQCIIERGLLTVRDLRIIGNETAPPFAGPNGTKPATGTVGLRLQIAHNVVLENVMVLNCTVGVETKDSWGINATSIHVEKCWCAFSINGGSTYATWTNCTANQVGYGILARTSTKAAAPTYGAFASIAAQQWINTRIEDAWYEYILYPHDAAIRGFTITGGYSEGIARDAVVSGFGFDQTHFHDPGSTLSTAVGLTVDRLSINRVGRMGQGGAGFYTFRCPAGASKNNVHCRLTLPCIGTQVSGGTLSSIVELIGADTGDPGAIQVTDAAGNNVFQVDAKDGGIKLKNVDNTDAAVLDWYEERTFTPTVRTSNDNQGDVTYVSADGWSTRVGNRVFFNLFVQWSAMSGAATGNLIIGGLPYASAATATSKSVISVVAQSITYPNQIAGLVLQNSTEIQPVTISTGAGYVELPADAAGNFYLAGSYMIAP